MSKVYADSADLQLFHDMLGRKIGELDQVCKDILDAISIAEGEWQDKKASDFRAKYTQEGGPAIDNLKQIMSENQGFINQKIGILDQYLNVSF